MLVNGVCYVNFIRNWMWIFYFGWVLIFFLLLCVVIVFFFMFLFFCILFIIVNGSMDVFDVEFFMVVILVKNVDKYLYIVVIVFVSLMMF